MVPTRTRTKESHSGLTLVVAAAIAVAPAAVSAKRAAPHAVPPVTYAGIRYVFPHFANENGTAQNGGVVQARDAKSDALLWTLKVYEVNHKPGMETDVQDVFITSARIEKGLLVITNERNETYEIDLAKRLVRRR